MLRKWLNFFLLRPSDVNSFYPFDSCGLAGSREWQKRAPTGVEARVGARFEGFLCPGHSRDVAGG